MANTPNRFTLVYQIPSATYRYTLGDDYVYLDFVDRNATIKYRRDSKKGNDTVLRMLKRGKIKATFARST